MMEIEHFVNPVKRQKFHKFDRVADLRITFYSACNQMDGQPTEEIALRQAVEEVRDPDTRKTADRQTDIHTCTYMYTHTGPDCQRNSGVFHWTNLPVHD